ncbi:MAG: UbiA family prenyltransferase [Actinobacteria bacterium]|nr:UbiA family prenyltransferase [Actinomycetota bacterium]
MSSPSSALPSAEVDGLSRAPHAEADVWQGPGLSPTRITRDGRVGQVAYLGLPLVVDLDGTLLRCDVLQESTLRLLGDSPWAAFRLPLWLARGKARLKREIAQRVDLDIATLPVDAKVLEWIRQCRAEGRKVILCSASDAKFVNQIAERLGVFDEVIASDGVTNVSSHRKAALLVERFGAKGFDYVGNSHDDVPVWAQARRAILVAVVPSVRRTAMRVASIEREFDRPAASVKASLAAMRLHQWAKNLLVFLPLLGSHRITEIALLSSSILAFLAFGLCASSVYIVNDLMDLQSDRRHSRKRMRPFASGALSPLTGLAVGSASLIAAFWLGWYASPAFDAWLAVYLAVTLLYTFLLKRKILVDALALAALYTLRILAGGAAAGMWPGFWLLAFSIFFFLSLAFVKRYSELKVVLNEGRDRTHGRDYLITDLPLIEMLGIVSGFSAVVVMALYLNGDSVARMYPHQNIVWLTVPILLYWVTRMWVKAHRGEMHDDPVVFAVSDRLSLLSIGAFVGVMLVAAMPW